MRELERILIFTRPLAQLGVRYMATGSVAVIVYGEPRLTHDVDLVVELEALDAARVVRAFPAEFFYCPPEEVIAVEVAREQRGHFNIIEFATGFKADMYVAGGDPLHAWGLKNAREITVESDRLLVAPPEYVIVRKLEYFREGGSEKHLRDIRSILQGSRALILFDELERFVHARHLQESWESVQAKI